MTASSNNQKVLGCYQWKRTPISTTGSEWQRVLPLPFRRGEGHNRCIQLTRPTSQSLFRNWCDRQSSSSSSSFSSSKTRPNRGRGRFVMLSFQTGSQSGLIRGFNESPAVRLLLAFPLTLNPSPLPKGRGKPECAVSRAQPRKLSVLSTSAGISEQPSCWRELLWPGTATLRGDKT